ncbi:MAG TPA: DUF1707 domain-containing protein [Streptosporangiaceae bacterium]
MARSEGDKTAGTTGSGHLRASDSDREHAIEVLKSGFMQGRLSKDEFDLRVGQAFTSRTRGELAPVTADLPIEVAGIGRLRKPARRPANKALVWGVCGLIAPAIFAAAIMPDDSVSWGTLAPLSFICFMCWLAAGICLLVAWHEKLTHPDGTAPGELAEDRLPRGPAGVRAGLAKAAVLGIWGLIMPAVLTVALIPGHTTVNVVVATAAFFYCLFWLAGGAVLLAYRRAGTRAERAPSRR